VINAILPPILHRFGDSIAQVKNRYISLPLLRLNPPTEGFHWDDIRKIFPWMSKDGQGTERRRKIAENLNRLSRAHERYRRQTDRETKDDRRNGDSI